jgi:hypothetical protein
VKAFGKKERFVNGVEKLLGSGADDGTRGKVAKETGIDSRTVNRFIRLTELNCELLNRVDSEEIPFIAAVSLSFLKENEQSALADVLNEKKRKIDVKKAAALKELSQNGGLDAAKIREVLSGKTAETEKKPAAVKISRDIFSKYFSSETPAVEIENTVDKALGYYFKAIERGEIDNSAPERATDRTPLIEPDEYAKIKAEQRRERLAFLGLDDEEDMER